MAFDPTNPADAALLPHMQGNILKGHGRDHTMHIFLQFEPSKRGQVINWIAGLVPDTITSAEKQLAERAAYKTNGTPGGIFASFYLSAKGYDALGINTMPNSAGFSKPLDRSFRAGMRNPLILQALNDNLSPESTWERGYLNDIHAMLLLAHDNADEMSTRAIELMTAAASFLKILHIEYGHVMRNADGRGVEHFGYVDGISQPLFLQEEVDDFKAGKTEPLSWNPEADRSLVLVQDIPGDTTAHGSYFVFRKLEQRVRDFKKAEDKLAQDLKNKGLPATDLKRVEAMLVGRYRDGTPLTLSKDDGLAGGATENNFDYRNDSKGAKCPFHAHIRKSNPRGTSADETPAQERSHMIARRGIPYGVRDVNINSSIDQLPVNGLGLLFMSYQASIETQFEFMQKTWINNPRFPSAGIGIDPVLGKGIVSKGGFAAEYNNPATIKFMPFNSFVTLKGGEYFFAPSITFLKSLVAAITPPVGTIV
jgi:Dyp-type peroxidase family